MRRPPVVPAMMALFDVVQFLPLLICNERRQLPVSFGNDFMDTPAGVAADLLKLRSGFIDDRRDFGELFRRQIKLSLQTFPHLFGHNRAVMNHEEKMPRVHRADECARHAAGEKHQKKTGDQFPLQRPIHCENSA